MEESNRKHLLILSGPMGNGHIRAAGALEACAAEKHPNLKVTNINVKDFMPVIYKKIFHDLYLYCANERPFLWSYIYYKTDNPEPKSLFEKFIKWFRMRITKPMMREVLRLKTGLHNLFSFFAC